MGYLRDMYFRVNSMYEREMMVNRYGKYVYKYDIEIEPNTKSKLIRLSPNVVRRVVK